MLLYIMMQLQELLLQNFVASTDAVTSTTALEKLHHNSNCFYHCIYRYKPWQSQPFLLSLTESQIRAIATPSATFVLYIYIWLFTHLLALKLLSNVS